GRTRRSTGTRAHTRVIWSPEPGPVQRAQEADRPAGQVVTLPPPLPSPQNDRAEDTELGSQASGRRSVIRTVAGLDFKPKQNYTKALQHFRPHPQKRPRVLSDGGDAELSAFSDPP